MGMDVYIDKVQQKVKGQWTNISVKGCEGYIGRRSIFSFLEDELEYIEGDDDIYRMYQITLKGLEKLKSNLTNLEEIQDNRIITNSRLALCFHYITCRVTDSSDIGEEPTINEYDLRLLIRTHD